MFRRFYRCTGGLPEPPGGAHGPHGPRRGREPAHRGLVRPPLGQSKLGWGRGAQPPLSFSLSPFPSPSGVLLGVGLGGRRPMGGLPLVGFGLYGGVAPRAASSPLPPLYTEEGHPLETHNCPEAVCGAPNSVFHLGHIFGELRRSPAGITSPSPSPRRRADGTHLLPLRLAVSSRRGTSPSCTYVELEGAIRSVLDRWSSKDCSTTSIALI